MATYYNDYPSLKLTEKDESKYIPAPVSSEKFVGIAGYASWGEIGHAIEVLPNTQTLKLGKILKKCSLPGIATKLFLATQKIGVYFWRLPKDDMAKATGKLTLRAGSASYAQFTTDGTTSLDTGAGNITFSITNDGSPVVFEYSAATGTLTDIISYFNSTFTDYVFSYDSENNIIKVETAETSENTIVIDITSNFYTLLGGSSPTNSVGELKIEINVSGKYYGSFGNDIEVVLTQNKETFGTDVYIDYQLDIIYDGVTQKTINNIELINTESSKYIVNVLEDSEFIELVNFDLSNFTQEEIDDCFDSQSSFISSLTGGDDGMDNHTKADYKTDLMSETVGLPVFNNISEGRFRMLINTYDEFDSDVINTYNSLASGRQDCVAVHSTEKDEDDPDTIRTSSLDLNSTSYGIIWTGWEKYWETTNSQYVYIPSAFRNAVDIMSQTYIWEPHAGANGVYSGSNLDTVLNEKTAVPVLQSGRNFVNPIIKTKSDFVIMGQKTMLRSLTSPLNRINTRLATLEFEWALWDIMKAQQFITYNTDDFRNDLLNSDLSKLKDTFLSHKGLASIDFVFDSVLNDEQVVNDNALMIEAHITPLKTNEKIGIVIVMHESGWTISELTVA